MGTRLAPVDPPGEDAQNQVRRDHPEHGPVGPSRLEGLPRWSTGRYRLSPLRRRTHSRRSLTTSSRSASVSASTPGVAPPTASTATTRPGSEGARPPASAQALRYASSHKRLELVVPRRLDLCLLPLEHPHRADLGIGVDVDFVLEERLPRSRANWPGVASNSASLARRSSSSGFKTGRGRRVNQAAARQPIGEPSRD